MYYDKDPEVHPSALIHGVAAEDALTAVRQRLMTMDVDNTGSGREFGLGFDSHGRLLEFVVMTFSDNRQYIIHAMKARKVYRNMIDKGGIR